MMPAVYATPCERAPGLPRRVDSASSEIETILSWWAILMAFGISVAIGIVFLITCALAFYEPVELLQEATPEPGDYNPVPEWYFLFLFQMLRYETFSGQWGQIIGSIVIPVAFMVWLIAIPFIFRNPERRPWTGL